MVSNEDLRLNSKESIQLLHEHKNPFKIYKTLQVTTASLFGQTFCAVCSLPWPVHSTKKSYIISLLPIEMPYC